MYRSYPVLMFSSRLALSHSRLHALGRDALPVSTSAPRKSPLVQRMQCARHARSFAVPSPSTRAPLPDSHPIRRHSSTLSKNGESAVGLPENCHRDSGGRSISSFSHCRVRQSEPHALLCVDLIAPILSPYFDSSSRAVGVELGTTMETWPNP